ncbi:MULTISPECIES: hypothetical protein [Salinibaculum]|uniref:hypothetical protein n=1 Tax=Salinibaculum TaxID=2732368 RepID=UPI0030D07EB0
MAAAVDPLSVDVDLEVTIDGRQCAVWNENDHVVVNAPTLATARAVLKGVEALPLDQTRLAARLAEADLAVELRVRHAPVARLGGRVVPSLLADLAGYDADISLRGVAVAAWRALL